MVFSYKAINREGKMVEGVHNAADKAQVVAYIKAQRMTPVSVGNGRSTDLKDILPKPKPKAKDLSMFCEQFCALLRAGVTILDSLKLLVEQTKNKTLIAAIQATIVGVTEGENLANSMAKSETFDETFISLVRAGEASGSLDVSLERMGNQYKKDAELAATVKKAMVYPIIVLVISVAVVVFMLLYIVPAFMSMFADIGIEMPKITLMVVAASDWLKNNYVTVILAIIGLIAASIAFIKSPTGKKTLSKAALMIPCVNTFTIKTSASKIARTMSTLLSAGMSVVEALTILEDTLQNYYYKQAIKEIREDVLVGQPMSRKFMEKGDLFPSMLSHMISVGEDTGDMTSMLIRTADYYDLEVETATQTLMSMMQPAVILLLAGIVCVLLAAVFSPMLALYDQLGDAL